jgi:hypothetical protein
MQHEKELAAATGAAAAASAKLAEREAAVADAAKDAGDAEHAHAAAVAALTAEHEAALDAVKVGCRKESCRVGTGIHDGHVRES